ncbi:energy transducer TonB [Autumnicola psychrophila]|uniref:Energy transducer TonB n=1 Tax=Autumnicola psychrophila TaxID=3075592 RepID=A0ABU3DWI0_9FLAO|nr:energy transducer TonB [Zunongwangia sp. F225]MDT0688088.1 energy transducer TonB [Zunongwangia sp. F225]
MLEKSKSKSVAKLKYVVLVPLAFIMLTYVAYSANRMNTPIQVESEKLTKETPLIKAAELPVQEMDIPFAIVDEVPIYPGCQDIASNQERKKCTSQKISLFVKFNFDKTVGEALGLTGQIHVTVQFKIDKNGNIQDVKSRAPAPELEDEAERVINNLPTMTPGKQNGEPVGVMYSLPIVFQVNE